MIKRSHIRQFLAIVDAGNFTLAASRIRVTQPTLSLGIKELERLAKAKLFIRERGRVRLTDAGAAFLPIARRLEAGFKEADRFNTAPVHDWPQLKIGVMRTVSDAVLGAVIGAFSQVFSIELIDGNEAELRTALGNGRVDIILGNLGKNLGAHEAFPLFEEPYVMLVPKSHALAQATTTRPEELASEIMIARRSCELLEETSRFFIRHQVRPRFALRSDNDSRCIAMVAAGLGITTAPLSLATDAVRPIAVEGYDFRRTIGLICDKDWLGGHGGELDSILAEIRTKISTSSEHKSLGT